MSAATRIPLADYAARKVAIIKPSALGDIIHSLPVLTALRHRFPQARLTMVVRPGMETLLEGNPDLDEILTYDRQAVRRSSLRLLPILRYLRTR